MAPSDTGQVLTLCVERERFGIPARLVREVARMPRLTPVPHAPKEMIGLANVRGVVIPVLSLARLLGRTPGAERRLVVTDAGEPSGLAVDAVAELVDARDGDASLELLDAAALIAKLLPSAAAQGARATAGAAVDEAAATIAQSISILTFVVADQGFALPLDMVEEVLRVPADIAVLPNADPAVIGSIDLRGGLLPVLSLARLLDLPVAGGSSGARILVVRIKQQRVGLVIDAVRSILRVAERDIDPLPVVLSRGDTEARVQAICRVGGGKLISVLAADHLLRAEITAQLGPAGADERVAASSEDAEGSEQILLFRVGDTEYGVPVAAVEEVALLPPKLARLPRSPAFVRGVMNLRGTAVPVIDQAQRFGAAGSRGGKPRVLVVNLDGTRVGFLVDMVTEIRRVGGSALRRAPELGGDETRIFDRVAIADEDGGMVLVVSPRELLDRTERDLLQAMSARGTA